MTIEDPRSYDRNVPESTAIIDEARKHDEKCDVEVHARAGHRRANAAVKGERVGRAQELRVEVDYPG
eukprot:6262125-Prymnesium_polylepis.1